MIIKKIHFEIDKTNKAKSFKKSIFQKYANYPVRDSDVIVVIGGDGFMLQILKKYQKEGVIKCQIWKKNREDLSLVCIFKIYLLFPWRDF